MSRPELPRAISCVFCAGAPVNPQTHNMSLIEVTGDIAARHFPAELPPLIFAVVLVGGQPGQIYTPTVRLRDPAGEVILEKSGIDIPFTTQITRINYAQALQMLSDGAEIIKGPGRYTMDFLIKGDVITSAELNVHPAPKPIKQKNGGQE